MVQKSLNQQLVVVSLKLQKITPVPNLGASIAGEYLRLGPVVISIWRPTLANTNTPVSFARKGSCKLDCTTYIYSRTRKSMKSRTLTSRQVAQQLMKVLRSLTTVFIRNQALTEIDSTRPCFWKKIIFFCHENSANVLVIILS